MLASLIVRMNTFPPSEEKDTPWTPLAAPSILCMPVILLAGLLPAVDRSNPVPSVYWKAALCLQPRTIILVPSAEKSRAAGFASGTVTVWPVRRAVVRLYAVSMLYS